MVLENDLVGASISFCLSAMFQRRPLSSNLFPCFWLEARNLLSGKPMASEPFLAGRLGEGRTCPNALNAECAVH